MPIESAFINDNGDNTTQRVGTFFQEASAIIGNKYIVLLYGEYVTAAIQAMQANINAISSSTSLQTAYQNNFNKWLSVHYFPSGQYVDFRWVVESINLPAINSKINDTALNLDVSKSIRYPLLENYGGIQEITMKIVEDRKMMQYAFLNSLQNQFFNAIELKPNSSFHKVSIVVIPLIQNEGITPTGSKTSSNDIINKNIGSIPGQLFEYNSAVLTSLPKINLSNANNNEPLKYDIIFKVPNPFNSSFNTNLKGLRNDSSDKATIRSTLGQSLDQDTINPNTLQYITSNFEASTTDIKSMAQRAGARTSNNTPPLTPITTPEPVPGFISTNPVPNINKIGTVGAGFFLGN